MGDVGEDDDDRHPCPEPWCVGGPQSGRQLVSGSVMLVRLNALAKQQRNFEVVTVDILQRSPFLPVGARDADTRSVSGVLDGSV